jgi:hypothetical protein
VTSFNNSEILLKGFGMMGLTYELSVDARKPWFTELRLIMKAMQVVE